MVLLSAAPTLWLPRKSLAAQIGQNAFLKNAIPAAGGGGSCATSDTALAHDEMLFGWESGDNPTAWTGPSSVTGADSVTFNTSYDTSALTTGKGTGQCNVGLRSTLTNNAGYDTYQFDRGSAIGAGTTVDVRFYIYVQVNVSASRIGILCGGQNSDPTGGLSFAVEMQTDTVPQVRGDGTTSSSWISLTTSSWNLIHVHIDATAASSTIAVNGGSAQGFTSGVSGVRYIYVGGCAVGAGLDAQWVTDLIAVNTP